LENREALVRRNKQLAQAMHQPPVEHRLREYFISSVARFPFQPLTKGWNRILFMRPDHLGDLLLATPAIRALKEARPYSEIHVLAGPWAAGILGNIPEIDQVLTVEFPGFNRGRVKTNYIEPYTQLVRISRQLRQIGYGHAVILRHDHWWGAMLAHVAGISERIGYDVKNVQPFLTQAYPHQHQHAIRQNLRLVESWTGFVPDEEVIYDLPVYDKEQIEVNNYLRGCGIADGQPYFCIHPGSGTWVKRWTNEQWAQVADILSEQLGAAVVFTGSDSERGLVAQIQNRMQRKSCTAAGELSIEQLSALYERALVVLGPDSGPLHVAAAVHTPTVALFGAADPVEFAPWGNRHKHIVLTSNIGCRPCRVLDWGDDDPAFHPCVREITVGQVLEAARSAINS